MNTISWKYVKPLQNISAIDDFEREHGFSFPNDLKDILVRNNGGRPSLRCYDTDEEAGKVFKTLLSFNPSDIETIYKCFPLDSSDKTLVPFASDPIGNYFVLKDGKIYLWEHESDSLVFLAQTFIEFLERLHE